jgi:hypothetical protein
MAAFASGEAAVLSHQSAGELWGVRRAPAGGESTSRFPAGEGDSREPAS